MNSSNKILTGVFIALFLGACNSEEGDLATVDYVDLERFVGTWYVIENIGLAPLENVQLALITEQGGAAPAWINLTSPS